MICRRGFGNVLAAAVFLSLWFGLTGFAWSQPTVQVLAGSPDEAIISDDGRATHRDARFRYPDQIGDMPLRKIIIYGDADVSAKYTLRGGGNGDAWISLFVFPGDSGLSIEAKAAEDRLIENMSASKIEPPAPPPPGLRDGRSGWYHGNLKGAPLTTGYMIVQRGRWLIKARFSVPDPAGQAAIDRTVKALTDVPWEWGPQESEEADKEVAQR